MNQRNQLISDLYPELKKVARRIMGGKPGYKDLLNEVMLSVLQSKSPRVPNDKENLFPYCVKALKMEATSSRSNFNMKFRSWSQQRTEVNEFVESIPDLTARIDNETIDVAINYLPELERKVFLLYVMPDFSFDDLSRETKIKKARLFDLVYEAKKQLRQYVELR